jgi:molecular chaperone HscB
MRASSQQHLQRAFRSACLAHDAPTRSRLVRPRFLSSNEQPHAVPTKNFYALLQLPQTFSIDDMQLKQNYRNLMNQHHPDKFHHHQDRSSTDGSDQPDDDFASLVTLAYDTLKRPHTRAQHLLALETGVDMDNDHEEHVLQDGEKLLGMETLMEIMELRERIDGTESSNERALQKLLQENQERIDETSQELETAFQAQDYDAALSLTAKMQYWNRIYETIRDKMHV